MIMIRYVLYAWALVLVSRPLVATAQLKIDNSISVDTLESWLYQEEWDQFPEADAIILNDYGALFFTLGDLSKIEYKYARRIKVLNEAGLKWANISLQIPHRKGDLTSKFKVTTYKLNPEGELVGFDLPARRVNIEKTNEEFQNVSFTFPFADVGSILEFSYSITTSNKSEILPWEFQRTLPMLKSEYHVYLPEIRPYYQVLEGNTERIQQFAKLFEQEGRWRNRRPAVSNNLQQIGFVPDNWNGRRVYLGRHYIYLHKNVEELREEPMAGNTENYIPRLQMQPIQKRGRLQQLSFGASRRGASVTELVPIEGDYERIRIMNALPNANWKSSPPASFNGVKEESFKQWEVLNRKLGRDPQFGKMVRQKGEEFANRAKRFVRRGENQSAVAEDLYEYVIDRISWNGEYAYLGDVETAFNQRVGNSADINLTLLILLQQAGFEAYPVLISTRKFGEANPFLPETDQFNHVIVALDYDGRIILLDAISQNHDFGMLPLEDLNGPGFLVDKENWGWLYVDSDFKVIRQAFSNFSLEETGHLEGELRIAFMEYAAAIERDKLQENEGDKDNYIKKELLRVDPETSVEDFELTFRDTLQNSLEVWCKLETNKFTRKTDDLVFLRPMLAYGMFSHPLPDTTRTLPVTFPAPSRDHFVICLDIPDDYEIVQIPEPILVSMVDEDAIFMFDSHIFKDCLYIVSSIYISRTTFPPDQYEELRRFFTYIVSKHEQDIVLRKMAQDENG